MVLSLDNFRRNRANEKDKDLDRDSINTKDNQDVRVDEREFYKIRNNDFRWVLRRGFRHENNSNTTYESINGNEETRNHKNSEL